MTKFTTNQTSETSDFSWASVCATSAYMIVAMTVVLGLIYPLAITGISQVIFPDQANGSLIEKDGKIVGSSMIGQDFSKGAYFQSRPSATADAPYNAAASSGTNFGPAHPKLKEAVSERVAVWQKKTGSNAAVPTDLVTASSSGLDPNITEEAARYQAGIVAKARGMTEHDVQALISEHVQTGLTGATPYVNVLELNLALDALNQPQKK